jgi:malonyl-CoA O-methyltransferase
MPNEITDEMAQLNKDLVRKHFNRHAHEYDQYAIIQAEMAKQLMERINLCCPQKEFLNILEIGCGTGILSELLRKKWSAARLTVIDISAEMIRQTKLKLGEDASHIRFITIDAEALVEQWNLNAMNSVEPFDLIISNAAFQWFQFPEQTIRGYLQKLIPDGLFAFTTFGPKTFYELHESFRAAETLLDITHVPHGQAFLDEVFWKSVFTGTGYVTYGRQFAWSQYEQIMYYPNVRDFLYSVKRVGAGNATGSHEANARVSRTLFSRMESYYTEHFAVEGGIRATYDVGFGIFS